MRIVRDENGFKLIDYLPEDIGAVSTETFTDFQQLIIQRIDKIINQTIDESFLDMVVQNSINNRLKVGFVIEFEINETGDLIYRGADGKPNRLPIGSNGQVLKVVNGLPDWEEQKTTKTVIVNTAVVQMEANTTYICKALELMVLTMPITGKVGDTIQLVGAGIFGWQLLHNDFQQIFFGDKFTTFDTGSISSTHSADGITLMCTTENNTWHVVNSNGNPEIR